MQHKVDLLVDAPANDVGAALADLSTYPHWNDLVHAAEPDSETGSWSTTLRAQVGPLARSKQLRFIRVRDSKEPGMRAVRFEREELDGRDHAHWVMEASVVEVDDASSRVTLMLSYSGGLWMPALGSVLTGAIERATKKLPEYVNSRT